MTIVCCPDCDHEWEDYDLVSADDYEKIEASHEEQTRAFDEVRSVLREIVNEFDSYEALNGKSSIEWVFFKEDIRRLRRLIE